jgi:hypothetical protein
MLSGVYIEKIMKNIKIVDGCWIWGMRVNNKGRGIFSVEKIINGKRKVSTYQVHRILDEHQNGELAVRYLDNICGNLRCCRPEHHRPRTFTARFWENVIKKGDCHIWNGSKLSGGYGHITIKGKSFLVHRMAYELHYLKAIPKGKMVLHSCHNRDCINPEHLRLGDHVDNMRDMMIANRQARGKEDGNAKLSLSEVKKIKRLLDSREFTHKEIAEMFNIGRTTVTDIRRGRTWSWL